MEKSSTDKNNAEITSPISMLVGTPRLLPGESIEEYQASLNALISEIDQPTPMIVFLLEQINEAFWWIRRHTRDKELMIFEEMASKLTKSHESNRRRAFFNALLQGQGDKHKDLQLALVQKEMSIEQVRVQAIRFCLKDLRAIDDLINRQIQTIRQFQKCIDQIELKPRLKKRMDLEIQRIEQDLRAVDGQSEKA